MTTLPAALMQQSARRLRVMALLYAAVFFLAGTAAGAAPARRARGVPRQSWTRWLPTVLSIGSALLVAFLASRPHLSSETVVRLGLSTRSSAASASRAPSTCSRRPGTTAMSPLMGLSWVAVWMLSFTIIVPSHPSSALVAVAGLGQRRADRGGIATRLGYLPVVPPLEFFLHAVLPYLMVVVIAGVAAKLVYSLGIDLKRALDLGSYQLEERLGSGGMGEVWRARHRLLARPAAVKLIRPEVFEAAGAAKQSALRLAVRARGADDVARCSRRTRFDLFDYGVTDDGAFYYVMELLDGFDLKTLVERFGPMPVERAVHLLVQVCHSLAEAHASGLVHRDITPANIFVCRYGRDVDFVKVLDFGLVKPEADAGGAATPASTHADRVGGTPAFMSPEQALGPAPDRRPRRHLCARLRRVLAGDRVARLPEANSAMAMAVAHSQAEPEPPSQPHGTADARVVRRAGPRVPGQVARPIARRPRRSLAHRLGVARRRAALGPGPRARLVEPASSRGPGQDAASPPTRRP